MTEIRNVASIRRWEALSERYTRLAGAFGFWREAPQQLLMLIIKYRELCAVAQLQFFQNGG